MLVIDMSRLGLHLIITIIIIIVIIVIMIMIIIISITVVRLHAIDIICRLSSVCLSATCVYCDNKRFINKP